MGAVPRAGVSVRRPREGGDRGRLELHVSGAGREGGDCQRERGAAHSPSLDFSLQNCGRSDSCVLEPVVCSALLQRPSWGN